MTGQTAVCFEVEEVFTEESDLLVLSLGFVSADDPLDIIHFACGRERSGSIPPPAEDLLYVERTDQSLACDGCDVQSLIGDHDRIELLLTENGARALGLPMHTHYLFSKHPDLQPAAFSMLAAMVAAGQQQVAVRPPLQVIDHPAP